MNRLISDPSTRLRLPLLLIATVLTWLYAAGLWTSAAWQVPASYVIDSLEMLARLKISGDQGLGFLVDKTMSDLGAPWTADWSSYPMPDAFLFIALGWISKVAGLIVTTNLALGLAHISAVFCFYICSRALGHRALFSAAGALLFGFSFYIFHRGLSHYSFALVYVVPAQLLSVWLIGSSRQLIEVRRWRWFCITTAIATGFGNPYFGFAYGQLLTFALLYQLVTTRRSQNLRLGAMCLAAFALTLVMLNYSSLLAMFGPASGLLDRNYAGTEIYGLRPIELLIPSYAHRWEFAANIGQYYATVTSLKGELFYPYIGIAGLAGLIVVIGGSVRQFLSRRNGFRPAYASTLLWLTLFFMVGGLNSLMALAGVDLFRAGNRYSIYLLAVALFALTSWATRHGRKLNSWVAVGITIPVLMVCLGDQIPKRMRSSDRQALAHKILVDQKLAHMLEKTLPQGSMVFQLPAVPFLEQPPTLRMTDYELFRPWLYSHEIRFSYGMLISEPALRWHQWIATRPASEMCTTLEAAGFAAIYFHKAAFADNGARLRKAFAALGKPLLFDEDDHVIFALQPAASPQLPNLRDPRLAGAWGRSIEPDNQVQIYATSGWFKWESSGASSWRWAGQDAAVTLWCPSDQPRKVALSFSVSAQSGTTISISHEEKEIARVTAKTTAPTDTELTLLLQPGANTLSFHYDGRLIKPSLADRRLLGFRVDDLNAEFVVQP